MQFLQLIYVQKVKVFLFLITHIVIGMMVHLFLHQV